MCNVHADVQDLLASLGEPLGSQSDSDTVQSRPLERDEDDTVSHAVYVPTALYTPPFVITDLVIGLLMLPQTDATASSEYRCPQETNDQLIRH